jgi:predicted permease
MAWRRPDEDFSDEVRAHLALETERLIEDGMSPEDARAAARKAFGNVARAEERFHESTRWVWLEQFAQDARYALRGFRKSPAFVATAVITLAVGLGLLTVVFTVFNAYVLRPFQVAGAERLYQLVWLAPGAGGRGFTWPDVDELRARTDLFDAVLGEDMRFVASDDRTLAAGYVSADYFTLLTPRVQLGRAVAPVDVGQPVAVLGHTAWQRLFASDPGVVGRSIDVDGRRITIVGVMGPQFAGLDSYPRDLWMPAEKAARRVPVEITVRLREGVTPEQAAGMLAPFVARAAPAGTNPRDVRAELRSNATANPLTLELIAVLAPVFAAFALVLLTACANVSNVMLARAVARHREIAVRLSIGASRPRIVRQLLTEGLLIAVISGFAAMTLAQWTLRLGTAALFGTLPPSLAAILRVAPMPFDYRVFFFALAVSAAATLAFALLPALQASRQPLTAALRGQRSGTRAASRLRSALVMAQVAVSVVLVVSALVLARNFTSIGRIDLGYRTAGVYSVNVRGEAEPGLIARMAQALAADPRVDDVAPTGGNPLFVQSRPVAAGPADGRAATATRFTFVSPEYFDILQIPIARGRGFRQDEAKTAARVAIVSEATARAFWPSSDPVGQIIRIEPPNGRPVEEIAGYTQVTVIGTARDVVSGMIVDGRDAGHIYLPADATNPQAIALLVRPRDAISFRPHMAREIFRPLGTDVDRFEVIPLVEIRDAQMYPLRAAAWIGGLLGSIALLLSISGLYGVLSYMLSQRTREIGIRMALGATARAVVALVVRQSLRLAGVGAIVGVAIAFAAMKALSSVITLEEVSLLDATPFVAGLAAALAATALAAYQPARRATRVDPADTLRAEG